ncbi:hypothetical protein C491_18614 [Natronococcus amylolyticus DSM 10524]|uniref:Rpa-associated protein n=1 Tax=Natronococcus amylolyticus DSM 10524 TaxID=1227497 RepID=L9X233_9EURY|nr:hypothetical protein [Natronococcus amylolyticus]ELY54643.1 hypothetical protein C491_18614 [Natronococcus amylolyticus DSM 10524]
MSANDDESSEEIPGREIAYRLFAAEYDDASLSYAESDEERAPNYVITPTGARLNRVFVAGTLTEVTSVNDEMVRARVVDPTGAFVVYAGQYQPDELATLESIEPPAFVAVTGKARTFQPDDADRVYTSIRPESIATVDADTRDRWVVSAAEQTLERIGAYAAATSLDADGDVLADALAEEGVESGLADGIPLAMDHYGTTPDYLAALRDCALEACEVVAGERDQVGGLALDPDGSSPEYGATFDSLAALGSIEPDESAVATAAEDDAPDPAEVTAGEDEPEPVATATADEFTASEDVPTDAAGEDPAFDADESDAVSTETDAPDPSEVTAGEDEPEQVTTATADEFAAAEEVPADAETNVEGETDIGSDDPSAEPEAATETDDLEFDDVEADEFGADDELESPSATDESDDDELGDFDGGGMYEMDDDEREQLEEEFGAEFATGTEVDDPGENDIDVPEPDTDTDAGTDEELGEASDLESETEPDPEPEPEPETDAVSSADEPDADNETDTDDDEEPASVDLEAAVVETMSELDDGDGADRSTVVETVASETGVDEDTVEDAIEEALMGGQCYEPADGTLKAI